MINTSAHHMAFPLSDGGWFVSCCWGRGREYSAEEVASIVAELRAEDPPSDCCVDLWRRIAEETEDIKQL